MAKKALCIGVGSYPINSRTKKNIDLKGAVNDANAWATLLNGHFAFPKSAIQIVLDQNATHAKIINGLKDLLRGAKPDDILVYFFSGHGTYIAAKSQVQMDYDQAQCPYDWEENLLVDNELRELFYNLPTGVKLAVISDSCHSGSVTRMGKEAMENVHHVVSMEGAAAGDLLAPTDGVQTPKHLPPAWFGGEELNEIDFGEIREQFGGAYSLFSPEHPEDEMNDLLLSGCNQLEFSWDAPFRGGHHGALTFYAINAIKMAHYQITYKDLRKQVRKWLAKYNFRQTPQLEGKAENKQRMVFS
ncbi:MAG: caspase family protein [Chloroflexota bacterium]